MSDAASPSERALNAAEAAALMSLRVVGGVAAGFKCVGGETRLADLRERGGYRVRFPATHAAHIEATQINTGGGVVGGDRLRFGFSAGPSTDVIVTTQAAERIYRTNGPDSTIDVRLSLADGARLDWLPQETILFSGARLRRRFDIDIAGSSRLLLVESITFGRISSGEAMGEGALHDTWRVRRDNKLVFADAVRISGDISQLLDRPAIAAGARAISFLVYVAPDALDRLASVRDALAAANSICGTSAWNGMLTARFIASDPAAVRRDLTRTIETLGRRPLPRVWQC